MCSCNVTDAAAFAVGLSSSSCSSSSLSLLLLLLLLCQVAVVAGSPIVTSSRDLRSEIPIGGRIWIANRTFVVTEPRDAITLTLSAPWPADEGSQAGLHACRLLVRSVYVRDASTRACLCVLRIW